MTEISGQIKFPSSAVKRMSPVFEREFRSTGRVARIFKREHCGVHTYEIRYRRNGFNVTAFGTNLTETIRQFILSAM